MNMELGGDGLQLRLRWIFARRIICDCKIKYSKGQQFSKYLHSRRSFSNSAENLLSNAASSTQAENILVDPFSKRRFDP